ncbi:MAG: agmatine deiminase family protein [Myxococcales bacterium]|nr:agmatine deiminase family protein [Myxococcales bacterium]
MPPRKRPARLAESAPVPAGSDLGVMPAEWEPHEATWLAFPHNTRDWPGKFGAIPWVWAEIVRLLTPGERVNLLVNDAAHEAKARRVLDAAHVDRSQLDFRRFPTNRVWARDFGPIFVRQKKGRRASVAIAGFKFNAWAKYPDWQKDTKVAAKAAKALDVPLLPVEAAGRPVVLEGGAIDVNGKGTILTTEECLLDPKVQVRNAGWTRIDYETLFARALGAPHTIWLGHGIAGDDTHGHVDDLCRFVDEGTVVLCQETNAHDPNYRPLSENWERLQSARLADGRRLNVVPLPMPSPLFFKGYRVPASYANFYIGNQVVLVPTFNDPRDRQALGLLAELFPGREVVGVHAVDLVWGFGTLHCLSQQQPRP